jgi:phage terminase Nu1 subunit (DNA packaging protein)
MAAVRCGLYSVVPLHVLSVMLPSDLQIRTCGLPTVDIDFLKVTLNQIRKKLADEDENDEDHTKVYTYTS